MGSEISCTATLNGHVSQGKALLETSYLQFRGEFRVKIAFIEMESVRAEDGTLRIGFGDGHLTLDLGRAAQRWAEKILHPPTLLDKLGVKGGEVISVIGALDADFVGLLERQAARISKGRALRGSDFIFLAAEQKDALDKLPRLKSYLKPAGAIWVIRPKGRKEITEMDVINGGKAAGLVDTKVAAFSRTHTAEKLVIPLRSR